MLHHGINISYVFGNAGYYYCRGENPYQATRLNALLTPDDFAIMEAAGFMHVRIPIDPFTFGVGLDGSILNTAINPDCNANLTALKNTIAEANDNGLAVIVDFHPIFLNEGHYDDILEASNGTVSNYTSIFRKELVTSPNISTQVWPNHPLVKFWSNFIQQFSDQDPSLVFFEIMNELLADFGNYYTSNPSPVGQWEKDWRIVQKETVKTIQNTISQQNLPNFKLICSSYLELPEDILGHQPDAGQPNTRTKWNDQIPVYYPGEVPNFAKLIYSYHMYEPYRFTHFQNSANLPVPPYLKSRDYDSYTASSPNTPERPEDDTTRGFPLDRSVSPMLVDCATAREIFLDDGYGNFYDSWVPMIATEFGAKRPAAAGMPEPEIPPIPHFGGMENLANLYRRQWHYDVRKGMEQQGMGWTLYEYMGYMGIMTGRLFHQGSTNGPIHGHPGFGNPGDLNRGNIDQGMVDALFGSSRPTQ